MIINAKDKLRGARAFVSDMLARQCLSEFLDAPEFSFSLLLNPDAKSVVSNFDAQICVATAGEYVGCAVSHLPVGIGLAKSEPFSFQTAQAILSDSELRNVFSFSKYSFSELLIKDLCDEPLLQERFSVYRSLKTAQFHSSGRSIREKKNNITFDCSDNKITCSNENYSVLASKFISDKNLAVSIIERCK